MTSNTELRSQLGRDILTAAERKGIATKNCYLVATRSHMPQDWLVTGYPDLKTASENASRLAASCDGEVFIWDVGAADLLKVQKVV
jgi:hypothetical protein